MIKTCIRQRFLFFSLWIFIFRIGSAREPVIHISPTREAPVIDGMLNDVAWNNIEPVTEFIQYNPKEGADPSEATEMYLTYDEHNIYLAFKCYDSERDGIRATMTQRDAWEDDDCIGFAFDTYNSCREAYLFNVNPYGIPVDFIWHHHGYTDHGWDADLNCAGVILDDSYNIEVAVPFRSLRMPATDSQVWRFYAFRSIHRKGEMVIWPPRSHAIPNYLAQACELHGISGIETGRHLTVLPYAFGSGIREDDGFEEEGNVGIDIKYGLSSNFMIDATINPDYSQIEADPDRVELSERYEELLPEKRPFFTEGTDIFVSDQSLFYSRTIRNPIAGFKLTGKAGKTRIGLLSAVDDPSDDDSNVFYNHLRFKTEILDQSHTGVVITNRDDPDNSEYNRTFSTDGLFRFHQIYSLKAQATYSVTGNDDDLHDAMGYNIRAERMGSKLYNNIWFQSYPEEFEAQSGSMWEVLGYRTAGMYHEYWIRSPGGGINEIMCATGARHRYNHEDGHDEDKEWISAELSTQGFWNKVELQRNREVVESKEFTVTSIEYEVWNSPSALLDHYMSFILGDAVNYFTTTFGWRYRLYYSTAVKPMRRLVLNLTFIREDFYERYRGKRSFLQNILWSKLSYQLRPSMFLRGIYQYNSMNKRSDASILFAYEYRPLSNIYVGVNFNEITDWNNATDNTELFAKVGYFWRL